MSVRFVCLTAIAAGTGIASAQPPRYQVTPVPLAQTLEGVIEVPPTMLSDTGWMAGIYGTQLVGPYGYRTVVWAPGSEMGQDIGAPLGLPVLLPGDINNGGMLVGKAAEEFIKLDTEGSTYSWQSGAFTVYPQLVPARYAHPGLTNNAGRVIGFANDGSFIGKKAVEYFPGAIMQLMPEVIGYNTALDVNNNNVILGTEIAGVYLWFPGEETRFILPPPPGLPYAELSVMNDRNDVVGQARGEGHTETRTAVVWLHGDEATPGQWALIPRNARRNRAVAINNRREVVGVSQDNAGAIGDHGWYWTPETGAAIPLEQLIDPPGIYAVGWANDINENGEIAAGITVRTTGESVVAILTPILGGVPCPADFDGSGVEEVPDIFAYLSAWFAGDQRADVDGTPGITVPDIFAFLSSWFAGCP